MGYAWLCLYIATIFAANWMITNIGFLPVGFGLMAPAGVYVVGLAFTFRDFVQQTLGKKWTLVAIVVGAALSAIVSPTLAVASGTAFLFSELMDFVVYTPLRKRDLVLAVVGSNIVGLVADSVVFLGLAFGSLQYLTGQIVGKAWMTVLAVVVIYAIRIIRSRVNRAMA